MGKASMLLEGQASGVALSWHLSGPNFLTEKLAPAVKMMSVAEFFSGDILKI